MEKALIPSQQNALRNDLITQTSRRESLLDWLEAYFELEDTTADSSREVKRRDITQYISYQVQATGSDRHRDWTPRQSKAFVNSMRKEIHEDGARVRNDRTINRIIAHLKHFAKWIHKYQPFTLGNPMAKIKAFRTASLLDIERATTETERRRILDAADMLLEIGGRSKDRHRFRGKDRPKRKGYRPYRNRAIVYVLQETGMRRGAVPKINLKDVDFTNRQIRTIEKGNREVFYDISTEGLQAVRDYMEMERTLDEEQFQSPALFLPANTVTNSKGILSPKSVNEIWNHVCDTAGVSGKTPHSARHAMGRHMMTKFKNPGAVQRQLNHTNPTYSLQYTRVTKEELQDALDDR